MPKSPATNPFMEWCLHKSQLSQWGKSGWFYSVPRSQDKKHSKCPELAEQTRHKPACYPEVSSINTSFQIQQALICFCKTQRKKPEMQHADIGIHFLTRGRYECLPFSNETKKILRTANHLRYFLAQKACHAVKWQKTHSPTSPQTPTLPL